MNGLHGEAAQLEFALWGDLHQLGAAQQVVLFQLVLDEADGQPGSVDGHVDLLEQVGQRADVVLMAMGDDHALDPVLVLHQIGEIGDDQVHAVHIAVREHQAAVHHHQVVLAFINGDVLAHLAQAAQRHYLHGHSRLRGLGRLCGGGCNSCGGAGAGAYPPPGAQAAARVRPRGLVRCPAGPQGGSARPPWAGSDAVLLPFVSSKLSGMPAARSRPCHGRAGPNDPMRQHAEGCAAPVCRCFGRPLSSHSSAGSRQMFLKGVQQRVRPAVPVMYQRSRGRAAAFMNRIRPSGRSPRAAPCSFFPH